MPSSGAANGSSLVARRLGAAVLCGLVAVLVLAACEEQPAVPKAATTPAQPAPAQPDPPAAPAPRSSCVPNVAIHGTATGGTIQGAIKDSVLYWAGARSNVECLRESQQRLEQRVGGDDTGGSFAYRVIRVHEAAGERYYMLKYVDGAPVCIINEEGNCTRKLSSLGDLDVDTLPASAPTLGGSETPPTLPDSAPSFRAESAANQTYTTGTAIDHLTLPEATGGDGTLAYSLSPDVPGLTFVPVARLLIGTPTAAGTYAMTYRVIDADANTSANDAATLAFTITVVAAPPPPEWAGAGTWVHRLSNWHFPVIGGDAGGPRRTITATVVRDRLAVTVHAAGLLVLDGAPNARFDVTATASGTIEASANELKIVVQSVTLPETLGHGVTLLPSWVALANGARGAAFRLAYTLTRNTLTVRHPLHGSLTLHRHGASPGPALDPRLLPPKVRPYRTWDTGRVLHWSPGGGAILFWLADGGDDAPSATSFAVYWAAPDAGPANLELVDTAPAAAACSHAQQQRHQGFQPDWTHWLCSASPALSGWGTYYWRVDAKNEHGTTRGDLWSYNAVNCTRRPAPRTCTGG